MLTPDSFPSYIKWQKCSPAVLPQVEWICTTCGVAESRCDEIIAFLSALFHSRMRGDQGWKLPCQIWLVGGRERWKTFSVVCSFVCDRFVGVKSFWLIFLIFCPHVIWSQRWFAVLRSTLVVSVVKWLPPKCPALRDEALINTTMSLMSAMGFDHTFCVLASFSFYLGPSC